MNQFKNGIDDALSTTIDLIANISTHDGSSIVRSSAQNGSSNASEFCSLSEPDSARSPLKVAEISL